MTKTLTIWRHAKTQEKQSGQSDLDRHLTEEGKTHAVAAANYLRDHALPDYVLCSPAMRTRETLAALGDPLPATELLQGLYLASGGELLAALQLADDANAHVMIVGHNPGLKELASNIIASAASADLQEAISEIQQKLPTGTLITITLNIEKWADLAPATGVLTDHKTPAALGD
jgi:phosphohistidine phosphatase